MRIPHGSVYFYGINIFKIFLEASATRDILFDGAFTVSVFVVIIIGQQIVIPYKFCIYNRWQGRIGGGEITGFTIEPIQAGKLNTEVIGGLVVMISVTRSPLFAKQ